LADEHITSNPLILYRKGFICMKCNGNSYHNPSNFMSCVLILWLCACTFSVCYIYVLYFCVVSVYAVLLCVIVLPMRLYVHHASVMVSGDPAWVAVNCMYCTVYLWSGCIHMFLPSTRATALAM
jgi:hypothetical protein